MSDNLESNSPEGSAGSPNLDASKGKNDSSLSTFDVSKLPELVESLVSKSVEKAVQSQKDKRFSTIEKDISDFKPVLEQVKNLLTPEQLKEYNRIQKDVEFEELKKAVYGNNPNGTPTNGTPKSTAEEVQSIFKEFGVDPNHPEAHTLFNLKGVELYKGVAQLAIKSKSTPVDSSEAPSLQGRPAPQAGIKELTAKYQQDILATPRGKSGDSIRRQLKEQARKNGVPVDSIAFV